MKPYLFKRYDIIINRDAETGWWFAYSGDMIICATNNAEETETDAAFICMSNYKIVQLLLAGGVD